MEKNILRLEDIPQSNIKHLIGFKTKLVTKENAGDGSGGKCIPIWPRVRGETKDNQNNEGKIGNEIDDKEENKVFSTPRVEKEVG